MLATAPVIRHGLALFAAGLVAVVFLVSGVLKLVDLTEFASSLSEWAVIPPWVRLLAVYAVPPIEVSLGGLWLIGYRRRLVSALVGGVLVVVTGVYGIQVVLGEVPDCGCFGRVMAYENAKQGAVFVIGRNVILIALLGASLVATGATRGRPPARPARGRRAPPGLTLIETVMIVAMVGLLVALLAPALGRAKTAGQEIVSASNLRSHAQVVAAYHNDWNDAFPYFTDPEATFTIFRYGDHLLRLQYFDAHAFWNFALAPGYYGGDVSHSSFFAPGRDRSYIMNDYVYSCTFLASHEFWNAETRTGPSQWRGVRQFEVAFPSEKGVYLAPNYSGELRNVNGRETLVTRDRKGMGAADGSAVFAGESEFLGVYPNGDGAWPGSFHRTATGPVLHTIDGSRGRDLAR